MAIFRSSVFVPISHVLEASLVASLEIPVKDNSEEIRALIFFRHPPLFAKSLREGMVLEGLECV